MTLPYQKPEMMILFHPLIQNLDCRITRKIRRLGEICAMMQILPDQCLTKNVDLLEPPLMPFLLHENIHGACPANVAPSASLTE